MHLHFLCLKKKLSGLRCSATHGSRLILKIDIHKKVKKKIKDKNRKIVLLNLNQR
jgi:hypothetical protein